MFKVRFVLAAAFLSFAAVSPAVAITINQFNVAATENFDSLANSGTSSMLPAGWSLAETGSTPDALYSTSSGTATGGDTYSFGAAGSSERALGTLRTGTLVSTIGAQVTNSTGGTITDLAIQYTGEQWRWGNNTRVDRLDFSYSLDATSLTTGTWIDVNALDFVAPNAAAGTGALNGNLATNQAAISHTIGGLSLAPGAALWIRWTDPDVASSDDGLGIDNFSITAVQQQTQPQAVPDHVPTGLALFTVLGLLLGRGALRQRGRS
jgi:hypothetical protein